MEVNYILGCTQFLWHLLTVTPGKKKKVLDLNVMSVGSKEREPPLLLSSISRGHFEKRISHVELTTLSSRIELLSSNEPNHGLLFFDVFCRELEHRGAYKWLWQGQENKQCQNKYWWSFIQARGQRRRALAWNTSWQSRFNQKELTVQRTSHCAKVNVTVVDCLLWFVDSSTEDILTASQMKGGGS